MGDRQRLAVQAHVVEKDDVDVERAGTPVDGALTHGLRFKALTAPQECERVQRGGDLDHHVEERALTVRTADRVGLVDLGHLGDIAETANSQPKEGLTVTEVRAESDERPMFRLRRRVRLGPGPADRHRRVDRIDLERWAELGELHVDRFDAIEGQHLVGYARDETLQEDVLRLLDDRHHPVGDQPVVDRVAEFVGPTGVSQIDVEGEVDPERLFQFTLVWEGSDDGDGAQAVDLDLVGHVTTIRTGQMKSGFGHTIGASNERPATNEPVHPSRYFCARNHLADRPSKAWKTGFMTSSLLHPFADPATPEDQFINIARAEGTTLWDDQGRTYLDAMGSLWFCQIGHGRAEMVEAIAHQLGTLDSHHIFAPFTHQPARDATEAIRSVSPLPDGRVFLGSSGSEAIDTSLKLMRQFHRLRGDTDRQLFLRRTRGYHGTNWGGTTAQGIELNREGWGDLVPHFIEIDPDDVEDAARVFADHGERIAGVISEPIQGAGGVYPPTSGYLEGLRRLATDNGALLCFDEVISGFGRTGSWFAAQTFDVVPDLITFAKGVTSGYQPLSGVILSSDVAAPFEEADAMLRTGYTYSGHPASCAAAITNLAIIEREGLVARANDIGRRFESAFAALTADGTIRGHRGIGAVRAAELHADGIGTRARMLDRGVVVRPIGDALAFCPPLSSTDAEIDTMIEVMVASIPC